MLADFGVPQVASALMHNSTILELRVMMRHAVPVFPAFDAVHWLLQLRALGLQENRLSGTLPSAWSNMKVQSCRTTPHLLETML